MDTPPFIHRDPRYDHGLNLVVILPTAVHGVPPSRSQVEVDVEPTIGEQHLEGPIVALFAVETPRRRAVVRPVQKVAALPPLRATDSGEIVVGDDFDDGEVPVELPERVGPVVLDSPIQRPLSQKKVERVDNLHGA
jgi:hypothetical protein